MHDVEYNSTEIGIRGKMWRMMGNFDGICEKCFGAGRGNIELGLYFVRNCTGMYVFTHYIKIYTRYQVYVYYFGRLY